MQCMARALADSVVPMPLWPWPWLASLACCRASCIAWAISWLQPYTDATVRALGAAGVRELDVVCPGFAVDCLETLEEIAMQNAEFFEEAGGHHLRYIPALNDSAAHVAALAGLLRRRGAVSPGGVRDA